MAITLSDYANVRSWSVDAVTVTVRQKLALGDVQDTITDAVRTPGNELRRSFPGASLTGDNVGFVIWSASLSNCSDVNPGDEIDDGTESFVVIDVADGHFEAARQYICKCVKRVENDA